MVFTYVDRDNRYHIDYKANPFGIRTMSKIKQSDLFLKYRLYVIGRCKELKESITSLLPEYSKAGWEVIMNYACFSTETLSAKEFKQLHEYEDNLIRTATAILLLNDNDIGGDTKRELFEAKVRCVPYIITTSTTLEQSANIMNLL